MFQAAWPHSLQRQRACRTNHRGPDCYICTCFAMLGQAASWCVVALPCRQQVWQFLNRMVIPPEQGGGFRMHDGERMYSTCLAIETVVAAMLLWQYQLSSRPYCQHHQPLLGSQRACNSGHCCSGCQHSTTHWACSCTPALTHVTVSHTACAASTVQSWCRKLELWQWPLAVALCCSCRGRE